MSEVTNLRRTDAKLTVVGTIAEIDLKGYNKDGEELVEGQQIESIRGTVTVKTDDINTVPFRVYVNRLTKDGKENAQFKGIQTVMSEYKSIAQVGADGATKVRVSGNLDLSTYKGQDGQLREGVMRFNASFFNRIKAGEEFTPKSDLNVEIFIRRFVPEMVNGEETGRIKVEGWTTMYNKDNGVALEPITLIAPETDGIADAIQSNFEMGQTARIYCDVVNSVRTITTEIPVVIGKPRVETRTEYRQELVITGATPAYGEDDANYLNPDAIKAAMNVRTERLEALKNADNKPSVNKAHKSTQVAQW